MEQSFLEKLTGPRLEKKFPTFMEHEDSFPLSQKLDTCSYSEPKAEESMLPHPIS